MLYRFAAGRSEGWLRLGTVAALAVVFVTPMLWALGHFGNDASSFRRAVIFAFSGMVLALWGGYGMGWAVRGFLVRTKESGQDGAEGVKPSAPIPGHANAGHARPGGARPDRP